MIVVHTHIKSGYATIKSSNSLLKERIIKSVHRIDINNGSVDIYEKNVVIQNDLFGKKKPVEGRAKLVISLPRSQTVVINYED